MQFQLVSSTQALIRNVNVRSELHGSDHVPAIDIAVTVTTSNEILQQFDPVLLPMLYEAADGASQGDLPDIDPISRSPKLRSTALGALTLKREYVGYEMKIEHGIDDESAITIDGCTVNKFKVDCHEGGSVELTFRIQASGVSSESMGMIGSLVGQEVMLKLIAPVAKMVGADGVVL